MDGAQQMANANDIIRWAESQLGTAEDPKGSNNVRYNTIYYGRSVSGASYPWCMAFIWCGFYEIGARNLFMGGGKTASCTALMRWARSNGRWVTSDYRAGDIMLFQFDTDDYADHVGIYTGDKSGSAYICIEGNTNDRVARIARQPSIILGAFRPPYDSTGSVPSEPAPAIIRRGMTGRPVKTLQIILDGYGYDIGPDGADGDFGANTEAALKKYQSDVNIEADGLCGEETKASFWRYL